VIVTVGGAATGMLTAFRRSEMVDGERLLKAEAHPDLDSGRRAVTRDALEEFRVIRRLPELALTTASTTASILTAAALPFTSSARTSAKRARATSVNSSGDTETNTMTRAAALFTGGGMVHDTAPANIGSM
jgi:hypothetical protein